MGRAAFGVRADQQGRALELQTAVVNEDLNLADLNVQTAQR